jgi:Na+-transporting NADH:ubiquinone oxidoreductase subunit NqrC
MQLRTLLIQKQRDVLWGLSLILVCISIIAQIILAGILIMTGTSDIQKRAKQEKLEKYNNITLAITTLISMVNVIINAFMTTTNPITFFDKSLASYLTNHSQKAYLSRN